MGLSGRYCFTLNASFNLRIDTFVYNSEESMKTVVAGALGECVRSRDLRLQLAQEAGWRTVFLGLAVKAEDFIQAIKDEKADLAGVSYRLTPETGELLLNFAELADDLHSKGVRFVLGLPPVARRAAQLQGFSERIYDGSQPTEELLAFLRGEDASLSGPENYPQNLVEQISKKSTYPLLASFGLPTMEATAEGIGALQKLRHWT